MTSILEKLEKEAHRADAALKLHQLRTAIEDYNTARAATGTGVAVASRFKLMNRLTEYELTGDHDHGHGPLQPGVTCTGGDCYVAMAREALFNGGFPKVEPLKVTPPIETRVFKVDDSQLQRDLGIVGEDGALVAQVFSTGPSDTEARKLAQMFAAMPLVLKALKRVANEDAPDAMYSGRLSLKSCQMVLNALAAMGIK